MKVKTLLFIILGLLTVVFGTPVYANGIPPLPHAFYGSVTLNGNPAPVGTTVEARGTGVTTAITGNPIVTTEVGKYGSADALGTKLIVQGNITDGATLTFYVNNVSTNQTAKWHSGDTTKLDLTVTITAPTVTTNAATVIGTTTATLNGNLTSLGSATSIAVSFQWGTSTSYSGETNTQTMTSTGSFSASLSGLSPNTTYHFRAKAVGAATSYGADITFTTLSSPAAGVGGSGVPTTTSVTTNVFGSTTGITLDSNGVVQNTVTFTSADGKISLTVPAGTIAKDKNGNPLSSLTAVVNASPPPPPAGANIIGLAYTFGPDGATFNPSLTLTWSYDPNTLPTGVAEEDLVIAYYDVSTSAWVNLQRVVDTASNKITASISHFTTFAIIGTVKLPPPPTPAVFSINSLNISPNEVFVGEIVTISASVANTGGQSGSYTVTLKINGVAETTKDITVDAGQTNTVTFTASRDKAGSYIVDVNGLTGSFTVKEKVVVPQAPTPAAFSINSLNISPTEVFVSETLTISASVANIGGQSGSYTVTLKINGVVEATKDVTVDAGQTKAVTFTISRDKAGSYTVDVNGLTGSFTVKEKVVVPPPPAKPFNLLLIGGIIAAVVVVGLVIFFLLRRRAA